MYSKNLIGVVVLHTYNKNILPLSKRNKENKFVHLAMKAASEIRPNGAKREK